jgi:two-component system NtrC family sensor kinase
MDMNKRDDENGNVPRTPAEEALRESEQKLNEIIHGTPNPQFVIDKNHVVIYWNKALETYSGIKAAAVIGTRGHWKALYARERPCMSDLLIDGQQELIPQWYKGKFSKSRIFEGTYEGIDFFPFMGDKGKWMLFTAAAIKDTKGGIVGAVETLTDITERKIAEEALRKAHDELELKVRERTAELTRLNESLHVQIQERIQAEEALRNSEQRQEDIIEHLPDPTFVVDKERRVIAWNKALEAMTGVKAEDILGKDNYEYAIPFYSCRRPALIDLIFEPGEDRNTLYYPNVQREGFALMAEATISPGKGKTLVVWAKATPLFDDNGCLSGAIESIKDITELRESERNYRQLFENAQEGILVIDNGNTLRLVNRHMAAMLGCTIQEMQGQSIFSFMDERSSKSYADNAGSLRGDKQQDFEFIRKDGGRIYASIGISPMINNAGKRTGTLAVITDITMRIRMEEELRKNLSFLQVLIDAIPNPVFFKDIRSQYQGCNKAFEQFTGVNRQDLIGKTVCDLFFGENADIDHEVDLELFKTGGIKVYENTVKSRDGVVHNVIYNKAVFNNADGTAAGLIGSMLDITEMKRIQKEKELFQSQLIQSSKMAAIGQMAAGVAHELNNPLTIIMGNMQFLMNRRVPDDIMKKILSEVELASQRCKKIVSDLLEFSRNREMELQVCKLDELLEHVVHLSSFQEYAKRVTISRQYAQDLPPVKVSISRIEQVCLNLITNAAQAISGEGSIVIETRWSPDKQNIEAIFTDTGDGIAAENISHIFEPFYTTKEKGTGLGLAVCYNIIKQHGGDITAASPGRGKGAVFTVILPVTVRG